MWHYDLRLRCPETGELEATEDIGLNFQRAIKVLLWQENSSPRSTYTIVSCDRPGSDAVHNVDLAYHVHQVAHAGKRNWSYVGYVGTPTDDWISHDPDNLAEVF